jgi:hypothetical protein
MLDRLVLKPLSPKGLGLMRRDGPTVEQSPRAPIGRPGHMAGLTYDEWAKATITASRAANAPAGVGLVAQLEVFLHGAARGSGGARLVTAHLGQA